MASNRTQGVGRALSLQHFIGHDGQMVHVNHDGMTVTALTVNGKLGLLMSSAIQTTLFKES